VVSPWESPTLWRGVDERPTGRLCGIRRRRWVAQIAIVDGTLIPTRDHRPAAPNKNYRYSSNLQVAIDAPPTRWSPSATRSPATATTRSSTAPQASTDNWPEVHHAGACTVKRHYGRWLLRCSRSALRERACATSRSTSSAVAGPGLTTLALAGEALADRSAAVETINWTVPDGLLDIGPEPFVRAHVAAALHRLSETARTATPVLIAKSLGTYAAALAAERELPAIWLTPLLHIEPIAEAITRNPAPALLVGGTRDQSWLPHVAVTTGKTLVTIEGGDHGLRPMGPLQAYADALGIVGTAMEVFLSEIS
jgi:hypothetical protein